jgi:predicted DsbA family dithiol-disulfide isomerase
MSAARTVHIEVVSDVICPWCLIGTRRLDKALAAVVAEHAGLEVEVVYRPFLLDPSTPPEGKDLREHLRRKYGDPEPMFRRVEAVAKQDGIDLDFKRIGRTSSTVGAHTLMRHAIAKGTQRALAKALFGAYFLEGRDVGSSDVLVPIATAHGFGADEATALLRDPDEVAQTKAEAREAADSGVSGVPFTVIASKLAVGGAQSVEVFKKAIEQALAT